ncbi:MAG: AraC family transcriptional regulator, partial [Balneolaceae bacterium]
LLFNIFSHPENKHILAYILRIVEHSQTPIWEVMEANYMYDLKIQDFANIANRSLSTFKREFKKHYKTSPGKWLTDRRLKRAESMLRSGNKSISEVSFDCGFKNSSHFSRVFKEKFNTSPSHFKKHSTVKETL